MTVCPKEFNYSLRLEDTHTHTAIHTQVHTYTHTHTHTHTRRGEKHSLNNITKEQAFLARRVCQRRVQFCLAVTRWVELWVDGTLVRGLARGCRAVSDKFDI